MSTYKGRTVTVLDDPHLAGTPATTEIFQNIKFADNSFAKVRKSDVT